MEQFYIGSGGRGLAALQEENERLKAENARLMAENEILRKNIDGLQSVIDAMAEACSFNPDSLRVQEMPGNVRSQTACNPNAPKIVRHGKIDRQYKQQLEGVGNPSCIVYDKVVRITGTFEQIGMSRDDVASSCQKLGAKSASEGICKSMDILILGNNPGPSKMEKVKQWQEAGLQIQVISQYDIKKVFDENVDLLKG